MSCAPVHQNELIEDLYEAIEVVVCDLDLRKEGFCLHLRDGTRVTGIVFDPTTVNPNWAVKHFPLQVPLPCPQARLIERTLKQQGLRLDRRITHLRENSYSASFEYSTLANPSKHFWVIIQSTHFSIVAQCVKSVILKHLKR